MATCGWARLFLHRLPSLLSLPPPPQEQQPASGLTQLDRLLIGTGLQLRISWTFRHCLVNQLRRKLRAETVCSVYFIICTTLQPAERVTQIPLGLRGNCPLLNAQLTGRHVNFYNLPSHKAFPASFPTLIQRIKDKLQLEKFVKKYKLQRLQ